MKWIVVILGLTNQQYWLDHAPFTTEKECRQYLQQQPLDGPLVLEGKTYKMRGVCVVMGNT